MRTTEDYAQLGWIGEKDVAVLREKGKHYGRSWIQRGGVGAFMMLARKWDRVENASKAVGYDVIAACQAEGADILDDIQDLRRYLLLLEGELIALAEEARQTQAGAALPGQFHHTG